MQTDLVRVRRLAFVALVVGVGVAAAKSSPPASEHTRREAVRLRAHFDSVDTELRSRDVSHLSDGQIARRKQLSGWLREYRNAGVFPINDQFAGRMVPFFRDSKGTLCAMAYLIDRSGRGDIVDKIAHSRNNAYVAQLVDDPALVEWLASNGLDAAEAARIQPEYDFNRTRHVETGFALTTLALGGGSLATATVNVVSPGRLSEAAGVLFGAAAIVNGIAHTDQNPGTDKVAYANMITGGVAVASSVGAFLWRRAHRSDKSTSIETGKRNSRLTIAPSIVPSQSAYRLGLTANASF